MRRHRERMDNVPIMHDYCCVKKTQKSAFISNKLGHIPFKNLGFYFFQPSTDANEAVQLLQRESFIIAVCNIRV